MMLSMFSPDFLIISPWYPHDFFNVPTLFPAFSHDFPAFSQGFPIIFPHFPIFPRVFPIFPPQATPRPRLRRHLRRALAAPWRRVGRRGVALRDGPRATGKTTTMGRGGVDEAAGMGWDEFSIITI